MDGTRFDRIARHVGGGASRRTVLKSLAGSAVGGAGLFSLRRQAVAAPVRLADLDPEEQAVVLYEALASLADSHQGRCDELAAKTNQFMQDNGDALKSVRTVEKGWSRAERLDNAAKYSDRVLTATKTLHFARERCGYRAGGAATPVAESFVPFDLDLQPQGLQESCDCGSDCPLSTGWCIYAWGSCIVGGCMCCWTSFCGSYDHCMEDCQANECCTATGICSSPAPPSEG